LIHYQFEVIHPFVDGNGRLGRLLIPLVLCLDGHLPEPMLYLSAYFERFRTSYYERLLRVSTHGEWEPWVIFFLRAVSHQASDAVERAKMLMDLRDRYRQSLLTARSSVLLFQLVDKLFETPWTTASRASRDLGITFRPAQAHLTRLTESGVLREVTGRKRDRIYLAEEIIRVSQEPLHLKNG
jgi:Fic family protein